MNDAHWHLVVNHFPIIGTLFGVGILISGLALKNNSIKNTAYLLFIVSAAFAYASMYSGEGAEEMVEDMPNIGKHIIHEHEEIAEKLAIVLYVLAAASIFGIYTHIKRKPQAKLVSYIALIISIIAVYFALQTGTSGGEIRHTEIRENSLQNAANHEVKNEQKQTQKEN